LIKNDAKVKCKTSTSKIKIVWKNQAKQNSFLENTYAIIKAKHFITSLTTVFRKTAFKKHKQFFEN